MSSIKISAGEVADRAAVATAPGDSRVPTMTTEPAEKVVMQVTVFASNVPALVSAFTEIVLAMTVPVMFVKRMRVVTELPF